jgi:N-methylhydantoinase A/oxoprolinase/acetone carboxylase beta subunit
VLGSPVVIFPPAAGVASALGALVSPLAFTAGRTRMMRLDQADWDAVNALFRELEAEAARELGLANVGPDQIEYHHWSEMRVLGQYHEISVPLDGIALDDSGLAAVVEAFHDAYRRRYGRALEGLPIEALHWRITATGPASSVGLRAEEETDQPAGVAIKGTRRACFPAADGRPVVGFRETPVYDRERLLPGMTFTGPAIIEEREATGVIWPGDRARVDRYGAIIVEVNAVDAEDPAHAVPREDRP